MNIQSIKTGHMTSYGDPDGALRSHLISALVAISVLFGSMFTAHSALMKLASADLGDRVLSSIEAVRTAIAEIPISAESRIALVESQHRDLIESPFYFGNVSPNKAEFSVSFTDIAQSPALLAAVAAVPEQGKGSESSYFGQIQAPMGTFEPSGDTTFSTVPDLGVTILSVGEFIRDTASAASLAVAANGSTVVVAMAEFSNAVTGKYIQAIQLWVEGSYTVAESSILVAYHSGDKISAAVSLAIPEARNKYDTLVHAWLSGTPIVAEALVRSQMQVGTYVANTLHTYREASAEIQRAAGADLAMLTVGTYQKTQALLNVVPGRVKASVGDFLLLEPVE